MSDFSTRTGFNRLRGIGQFQLSHLWKIKIFSPPAGVVSQTDIDTIIITARTLSSIPGLSRGKVKVRYMDLEYTVPMGQTVTGDHELTCECLLDENGNIYSAVYNWYKAIPRIVSTVGLNSAKSNGLILLYAMDGITVRRSYEVEGIYPMEVPELTGWDQDSSDNHIKFTMKFAFDMIKPYNNIGSNLENTETE